MSNQKAYAFKNVLTLPTKTNSFVSESSVPLDFNKTNKTVGVSKVRAPNSKTHKKTGENIENVVSFTTKVSAGASSSSSLPLQCEDILAEVARMVAFGEDAIRQCTSLVYSSQVCMQSVSLLQTQLHESLLQAVAIYKEMELELSRSVAGVVNVIKLQYLASRVRSTYTVASSMLMAVNALSISCNSYSSAAQHLANASSEFAAQAAEMHFIAKDFSSVGSVPPSAIVKGYLSTIEAEYHKVLNCSFASQGIVNSVANNANGTANLVKMAQISLEAITSVNNDASSIVSSF